MLLFDMGLPMIIPSAVLMAVALVPIVVVEAYVVATKLQVSVKNVFAALTIANLVSTFLGIPVTWFLLALLQIACVIVLGTIARPIPSSDFFSLTLGAPWVYPGHSNEKLIILGAMLFLLIPYGLASWGIEYFVVKTMLAKKHDVSYSLQELKFSVGKANLISYCLLAIFVILFTLFLQN